MPEPDSEHYARTEQQPWEEIVPRLISYALKRARKRYWQGVFGGWMPGGREASDIAMEAIEKIISGERAWDARREPDVFKVLAGVVDSLLSHLVESWENKHMCTQRQLPSTTMPDGEEDSRSKERSDPGDTPSGAAIRRERSKQSEAFLSQLHTFLKDEPTLQKLVVCLSDGEGKRADIAEELGVTPKQVTHLREKLANRLKAFQQQFASKGGCSNA